MKLNEFFEDCKKEPVGAITLLVLVLGLIVSFFGIMYASLQLEKKEVVYGTVKESSIFERWMP